MTGEYVAHDAEVYKKADGAFEVMCLTPRCRFRIDVKDYAGKPGDYTLARREAEAHSRGRFR